MSDWHSQLPPSSLLVLGIISFSGAVVSTCEGRTWARTGRTIYRAKEPSARFGGWSYYLGSLVFGALYLYETQ